MDNIIFYQAHETGKGLPYSIVGHDELVASNALFVPSLRDFHVIFWFKSGTGKYHIDFVEYTFRPNTLILVSKDHLHYFESFNASCELQSIVFRPNFMFQKDTDLKHLFRFDAGCHHDGIQVIELNRVQQAFLENISSQMKTVYHEWEGKSQGEAFYHLLSLFLVQCDKIQQYNGVGEVPQDEHSKVILTFNELLEAHFRTQFKVEFYADKLGLTLKTLAKIIRERYKVSTKAIIDERRVLEIKRQLRGTMKSVKEIAFDLGFDEPTNMVKYFKKHVGMTPNGFRVSEDYS